MAGRSRPQDGVASARLCPAIHVFLPRIIQDVGARDNMFAGWDAAGAKWFGYPTF
jgi:hypothetical protein